MGRANPDNLRAALWAFRTARRTGRILRDDGLDAAIGPDPPPRVDATASRGVAAVMRRRDDTCLVRAIVWQSWEASQGRRRDLIVGVTSPGDFHAHAWLEGDPVDPGLDEILRRPAPPADRTR